MMYAFNKTFFNNFYYYLKKNSHYNNDHFREKIIYCYAMQRTSQYKNRQTIIKHALHILHAKCIFFYFDVTWACFW